MSARHRLESKLRAVVHSLDVQSDRLDVLRARIVAAPTEEEQIEATLDAVELSHRIDADMRTLRAIETGIEKLSQMERRTIQ